MKKLTKIGKLAISGVAVVTIAGCLVGYSSYSNAQKLELATSELKSEKRSYSEAKQALEALRDKNDFFKESTTKDSLGTVIKTVDNLTIKDHSNYSDLKKESANLKKEIKLLKETAEDIQTDFELQESVNALFETTEKGSEKVVALQGNIITSSLAIVDSVTTDTVTKFKEVNYQEVKKKSEWRKAINSLMDNADDQLKQIEKSKQILEKVFKDNKVINTDQKNYDSAKSEIDKIRNKKAKKELSDKLAKVKQEIDSKAKTESEKKTSEQAVAESTTQKAQEQASQVVQSETSANNGSPQTSTNNGTQESYSPYVSEQGTGGSGSSAGSGSNGSTGGGSTGGNSTGGGQTGGNQGGSTPAQPTEPSEPSTPSGPPAGWIVPPYPIGSMELVNWLADQGYSGYDSSGGYVRPY